MGDSVVETPYGVLRKESDHSWVIGDSEQMSRFTSLGDALLSLSNHCEQSGCSYSVVFHDSVPNLLDAVHAEDGTELFPSSDNGWHRIDDYWVPTQLLPLGDAESVAELVAEFGEMGVHVELFNYEGLYVIRWGVVDFDDSGTTVLGPISEDEAILAAEEKAYEAGDENGLALPYMLGLANLEESERFELPAGSVEAAQARTAWPYDTSAEVVVAVHLLVSEGRERWFVTPTNSTAVLGSYDTWPSLRDAVWVPDGWEIEVEWFVEEPPD